MKGISSAKELSEAMNGRGYPVKLGAIRKHWERKFIPSTPYVAWYCKFLEIGSDFLLFGTQPKKLTKDDLLAVLGDMIADAGGTIPGDDPDIVRAAQLLMKIKDDEKKKAVVRMLEAFIGDTA